MRALIPSRLSNYLAVGLVAALPVSTETCESVCNIEAIPLEVNGEQVGVVTVWEDSEFLHVTYKITDDHWDLVNTHLYVGRNEPANAFHGQYPYSDHQIYGNFDRYDLSLRSLGATFKTHLYIAAQADLEAFGGFEDPSLDAFADQMPERAVPVTITRVDGMASTWQVEVRGFEALDGVWPAWSAAVHPDMLDDMNRPMDMWSTYDPAVDELASVAYPENYPKVNWLLNSYQPGQVFVDGTMLTAAEMQAAIWTLLDEVPDHAGLGRINPAHVRELLMRASYAGVGYTPGCGDEVATLFVAHSGRGAPMLVSVPFEDMGVMCAPIIEQGDAWANGDDIGIERGSYFEWSCF